MAVVLTILGVANIIYGITIMMVNSGTLFFAVWYVLGAALLAAAWVTYADLWKAIPKVVLGIGAGCLALGLGVLVATQVMIFSQFNSKGEDNLDYLVVLGAQVLDEETPSVVLEHRLQAAVEYLEANPQTACIVSGGQGPNEPVPEAHVMAHYLEAHGVDAQRIIVEDESLNTAQNIANSMAFFNPQEARVGVLTNNFHVYRAVKIAEKAGIQNVSGIAAYSVEWYLPNNLLRESLGVVKDFAVGNI